MDTADKRWETIVRMWNEDYRWLYYLAGILTGIMVFPAIELLVRNSDELLSGLVPETIGILATVFFIDSLYRRRENEHYKKQLIREIESPDNGTALRAIDNLNSLGLLDGNSGITKNRIIHAFNWRNAKLSSINLQGTHLLSGIISGAQVSGTNFSDSLLLEMDMSQIKMAIGAKFERTSIVRADISHSEFIVAIFNESRFDNCKLSHCSFLKSKFCNAVLNNCDFSESLLFGCDFSGANLKNCIMKNSRLVGKMMLDTVEAENPAIFSKDTILPDGTNYKPELGLEQMRRFGCIIDVEE